MKPVIPKGYRPMSLPIINYKQSCDLKMANNPGSRLNYLLYNFN